MERPDHNLETTTLSLRDIGRMFLDEFWNWLEREDTKACNAINTLEDES